MRPLTGRESSILALIAQSGGLSEGDKRRILAELDGPALEVARALCGEEGVSEWAATAAAGLIGWANQQRGRSRR
jgi:hypothetical protein